MSEGPGVRATVGAADVLSHAISAFNQSARTLTDRATAAVRDAEGRATIEHEKRRRLLDETRRDRARAEAALAACTEDCEVLQRAVAAVIERERIAIERHAASERAVTLLAEARSRFTRQAQVFEGALEKALPGGQSAAAYRDQLQNYLTSGSSASAPHTASGDLIPPSGVSASTVQNGPSTISLSEVIDDSAGPPAFEKVSREQVEWGIDVLKRVVEPAVRIGKGSEYFADRDAAEGLSGDRSYSGVYRWFFEPSHAIKVSRLSDGHLDVTNGYHRIFVARQLGVRDLPAQVR